MKGKICIGLVLIVAFLFVVRFVTPFAPERLALSSGEKEVPFAFPQIEEIVEKPLLYLANGNEAIAFTSADGQYVVKFFSEKPFAKKMRVKLRPWVRRTFRSKEKKKCKKTLVQTLDRYEKGFSLLPDETAMVALHRYASPERLPTCVLIDYQGKEHRVDLNTLAFAVQKKCHVLSKEEFKEQKEDLDAAFCNLFSEMAHHGFVNLSSGFYIPNFAILDGKAVMIDLGNLEYLPEKAYSLEEARLRERYFAVVSN